MSAGSVPDSRSGRSPPPRGRTAPPRRRRGRAGSRRTAATPRRRSRTAARPGRRPRPAAGRRRRPVPTPGGSSARSVAIRAMRSTDCRCETSTCRPGIVRQAAAPQRAARESSRLRRAPAAASRARGVPEIGRRRPAATSRWRCATSTPAAGRCRVGRQPRDGLLVGRDRVAGALRAEHESRCRARDRRPPTGRRRGSPAAGRDASSSSAGVPSALGDGRAAAPPPRPARRPRADTSTPAATCPSSRSGQPTSRQAASERSSSRVAGGWRHVARSARQRQSEGGAGLHEPQVEEGVPAAPLGERRGQRVEASPRSPRRGRGVAEPCRRNRGRRSWRGCSRWRTRPRRRARPRWPRR